VKTSSRSAATNAHQLFEALTRHQASWAPVFVARAALGLSSVLVAPSEADGAVAVLSLAEASAWLKQRGEAKGAAKVVGTATPGSAWVVTITADGAAVSAVAMAPFLAG
jgi:hypothetical protein